jgi:hypothetical protein
LVTDFVPPTFADKLRELDISFFDANGNAFFAVDFTLRAASTFHAVFIRVRCGTPPNKPEN